jgi:hypothetical protein
MRGKHSFLSPPAEIFDCVAITLPPGTKALPRPPGKEGNGFAGLAAISQQLDTLIARIETGSITLQDALAEIKSVREGLR